MADFEPYTPPEVQRLKERHKKGLPKVDAAVEWLLATIESGEEYAEYNVNIHIHAGEVKTVERMVKTRER